MPSTADALLLDANVLIAATIADHEHHERARQLLGDSRRFAIPHRPRVHRSGTWFESFCDELTAPAEASCRGWQIHHEQDGRSTTGTVADPPRQRLKHPRCLMNLPSYLDRRAAPLVTEALGDTRVVVVIGARQAGKSTLVHEVSQDISNVRERRLDRPTNSKRRRQTRSPSLSMTACWWWTRSNVPLSCCFPSRLGSMLISARANTS
jgi:hypothetical protein